MIFRPIINQVADLRATALTVPPIQNTCLLAANAGCCDPAMYNEARQPSACMPAWSARVALRWFVVGAATTALRLFVEG